MLWIDAAMVFGGIAAAALVISHIGRIATPKTR